MPKLVIFKGENVENETRLAGRPVRLGRDNRNDIVLEDKSVSRFHAEVRPEGDRYVIVDLKSRNGVWVNGQQVKGKTALTLGAPVTLGAFEVTLEDDVPTGEFDEESPLLAPPGTMVNTPTDQSIGASRSATSPSMKAQEKSQRQMVVWGGAAVAVLLVSGIAFAVIRYRRPAPTTTAEVVTPPPLPSTSTIPTVVVPEPPPVDPNAAIDKHLDDARAAMGKNDLAGARQHVAAVLELAPANQAANDLKRQIDAAAPTTTTTPPRKPGPVTTTTTTAPVSAEIETTGIPRRPNEAWPDYLVRVQRIDTNLKLGKSFVDKRDFMSALARFRLVAGEQKGYQDVEALIADALMKQRVALEQAMKYGQDSEKQSPPKWSDALKWYQQALFIDPSGAAAVRDKIGPLTERVTKQGTDAFNTGDVLRKRGDNARAIEAYKVAADVLPPNHEKKAEAQKWVETLKP